MALLWYALRSKPRKEDVVWRQLHTQGIEVYYPRLKVQPVNPRSKKVRPYFPGYMFVQTEIETVGLIDVPVDAVCDGSGVFWG